MSAAARILPFLADEALSRSRPRTRPSCTPSVPSSSRASPARPSAPASWAPSSSTAAARWACAASATSARGRTATSTTSSRSRPSARSPTSSSPGPRSTSWPTASPARRRARQGVEGRVRRAGPRRRRGGRAGVCPRALRPDGVGADRGASPPLRRPAVLRCRPRRSGRPVGRPRREVPRGRARSGSAPAAGTSRGMPAPARACGSTSARAPRGHVEEKSAARSASASDSGGWDATCKIVRTMTEDDGIERAIAGALRSAIREHGPITLDRIGSAVKRIVGNLRNAKAGSLARALAAHRWAGTTEEERADAMKKLATNRWASMTEAERSAEMKRRRALGAKRKKAAG
jgi:hypothetical protein